MFAYLTNFASTSDERLPIIQEIIARANQFTNRTIRDAYIPGTLMADIYPPTVQRPALLRMVEALGCRDTALRRDECGDWRINGKYGHIYAVPEGFQIYFRGALESEEPISPRGWTWAKKAMAFAKVTQDGDEEGILILDRLPTLSEAEIIRDKLWIAKKREVSAEELDRLRRQGFRSGGVGLGVGSSSSDEAA